MIHHLIELRKRALKTLAIFALLFCIFFYYSAELFHSVVMPVLNVLANNDTLIATQITSSLFTPIKLAADAALLLTVPFMLFQLWMFAGPGLYKNERNGLRWGMLSSVMLFCTGVLFCFYGVLPFMLQFFAHAMPKGVRLLPDIVYAVDFITRMLLIFGLCFQVPLLCLLFVRLQLITIAALRTIRPYVIVAAFIVGMLLTPPDMLSQVMLAVPLCLLYELGIVLAVCFTKNNEQMSAA